MNKRWSFVQVSVCQSRWSCCHFVMVVGCGKRSCAYTDMYCLEIRGHREFLRAAGVDWAGSVGRSDVAHVQVDSVTPHEMPKRPASRQGAGQAPGEPCKKETVVVDTVYIGGGTPSLLDPAHLQ